MWQDSADRNKGKLTVVYLLDSISKSKTPGTRESLLYADRQFVSTGCYIFIYSYAPALVLAGALNISSSVSAASSSLDFIAWL